MRRRCATSARSTSDAKGTSVATLLRTDTTRSAGMPQPTRPTGRSEAITMSSLPVRDPCADALLTPENAILVLIDYQPPQVNTIASMDRPTLINNVVTLAKIAKAYDLPIVLSTVNVTTGVNPDTIPQL